MNPDETNDETTEGGDAAPQVEINTDGGSDDAASEEDASSEEE